jgi:hypothetical protein
MAKALELVLAFSQLVWVMGLEVCTLAMAMVTAPAGVQAMAPITAKASIVEAAQLDSSLQ